MWHLVIANILRARFRNTLLLFSSASAFFLFALLGALIGTLHYGLVQDPHLRIVLKRSYGGTQAPFAAVERIREVPGVAAVTPSLSLPTYYRNRRDYLLVVAVMPEDYAEVFQMELSSNVRACMEATPLALIADAGTAHVHGWRPGDAIPLTSTLHRTNTGDNTWPFAFCGTFSAPKETGHTLLARFDQVADFDLYPGRAISSLYARVVDPSRLAQTGKAIDALFAEDLYAMRSVALNAYERQAIGHYADVGALAVTILAAVFFAMILMSGSVAMQAIRERVPELAVIRALGFPNRSILLLLLLETTLLSVAGASIGMASAFALEPTLVGHLRELVGRVELRASALPWAALLAIGVGVVVGAVPAIGAVRLPIADALGAWHGGSLAKKSA